MYRIGFACKIMLGGDGLSRQAIKEQTERLNLKSTTVKYLNSSTETKAYDKLWSVVRHNMFALRKQILYVSALPPQLHMMRIGSEVLPMYTHEIWKKFYNPGVMAFVSSQLSEIGDLIRKNDIRISFHPGQFTCFSSDRPDVVERSIAEFEYHTDVLRMMGFCQKFQDAKCNIHMSGKLGVEGFLNAYNKLSSSAKHIITVENDEMSRGLDDVLKVRDHLPIVLDVHHHWCRTGEYIDPSDERVKSVISSWRGVRPTMHYSLSREALLVDHSKDVRSNLDKLLESGYKKQKLRAHSDYMWNTATNEWIKGFLPDFDIMVEAKYKNLASIKLFREIK